MTIKECKEQVSNSELSKDMLISCYKSLDKKVTKCAYNRKKYQHESTNNWDGDFQKFISMRNIIVRALKKNYNFSDDEIKIMSAENTGSVGEELCAEIIGLIESNKFSLTDS